MISQAESERLSAAATARAEATVDAHFPAVGERPDRNPTPSQAFCPHCGIRLTPLP